jgi:ectoine hydroxylase-related dioxygenase (phytanoyl-CoA dioxygenase family)
VNEKYDKQFSRISDLDDWLIECEKLDMGVAKDLRDEFKDSSDVRELISRSSLVQFTETLLDIPLELHGVIRLRTAMHNADYTKSRPHQDLPLWKNDPHEVNVWVPLVDVGVGMAPMKFYGHGVGELPHIENEFHQMEIPEKYYKDLDMREIPVKRGEVLYFSPMQIHASSENETSSVRWSVDFRFKKRANCGR